jgi:hypothetical protein
MTTEPTIPVNAKDLAYVLNTQPGGYSPQRHTDAVRNLRAALAAATPPPTLRDKMAQVICAADGGRSPKYWQPYADAALADAFVWVLLDHAHDGEDHGLDYLAARDAFDFGPDDEDPPIYLQVKAERDYLAWLEHGFHDSSP